MNYIKKTAKIGLLCTSLSGIFLQTYISWRSNANHNNKINLVFDLDDTLIYSQKIYKFNNYNNKYIRNYDFKTNLEYKPNNEQHYVWIRPHTKLFLKLISKFTNIYVFTAAKKNYADNIINEIFEKKPIRSLYYDNFQLLGKKDLRIIDFNIDLNKTFLIDDKISNKVEKQNFYHIPRFYYNQKYDFEIIKLFIWIIKKDLVYLRNSLA